MDHAAMHRNRFTENIFNEARAARICHRLDTTFRKSQVDGLGEVQGDCGGIP